MAEGASPLRYEGWTFVGELGLDGRLRSVRGTTPIAEACRRAGLRGLVVPVENAAEAAAVGGLEVIGVPTFSALLRHLDGGPCLPPVRVDTNELIAGAASHPGGPDLADVRKQGAARRALEVAAAGGHNLLLVGPPG